MGGQPGARFAVILGQGGIAVAAAKRSKHLPNMPTLKELGVDMIDALDRGVALRGALPGLTPWSRARGSK